MDRRLFVSDLARYAALCAVVPNVWRVTSRPLFADDPFTLGVASGDPTPNGGVLWTRLAPRPFEPEGGMDGQRVTVDWEVADDEAFTKVVQKGRATAAHELSYSVHVNVEGLPADRWFFYRFRTGDAVSQVGRFRTTPADGAMQPLTFAFASCQNWAQGLFTAYEHMAR
jgi:alkaline phosphatase D